MTTTHSLVWKAGRLVYWGLQPHQRPAQEPEYRELVDLYFDDVAFRTMVRELADGQGLDVLDVSGHGMVLVPLRDSIFTMKPADFRPNTSKAEDRLLDGLVQLAIAATVFPRARDLDEDPNAVRATLTVDEIETHLRQLCERLSEEAKTAPDPNADDEHRGLTEAWRVYMQRLDAVETRDARKGMRATRRIIETSLDRMRELGFFTHVRAGSETGWQPTRRYQVMVQQFAASSLFELVRRAVDSARANAAPKANG